MSLVINIENFPNWTSIFEEIERKWQEKTASTAPNHDGTPKIHKEERKPRSSTMLEPRSTEHYKEERKPRSSTMLEPKSTEKYKPSRRASDPSELSSTLKIPQPRVRHFSAPPSPEVDRAKILSDSRLTENAKQLSDQELALLYEDILKPLDFYEMLHERRKKHYCDWKDQNCEVKALHGQCQLNIKYCYT